MLRIAWRSWWRSVLACAVAAALFVVNVELLNHRPANLLHNVVDYTGAVTIVFAAVCATVIVPAFLILSHTVPSPRRSVCVALAVCLAVTTLLAFSMAFREHQDPATLFELIAWLINRPQFLVEAALGGIPYLAAGTVFGYTWGRSPGVPQPAESEARHNTTGV